MEAQRSKQEESYWLPITTPKSTTIFKASLRLPPYVQNSMHANALRRLHELQPLCHRTLPDNCQDILHEAYSSTSDSIAEYLLTEELSHFAHAVELRASCNNAKRHIHRYSTAVPAKYRELLHVAIRDPSSPRTAHSIDEIAVSCLQLAVFFTRMRSKVRN